MPGHRSPSLLRGLLLGSAFLIAGTLAASVHPRPIHASDAAGVYSLVEDVVFETDPSRPDDRVRIRIYGVHALAYRVESGERRGVGLYTDPAAGYLYFACDPADAATCRLEWQDLVKAIGDERCAAYGLRYLTDPKPNGRLRPADEAPANPDRYPIGQGLLMTRQGDVNTCADLRAFAATRGAPSTTPGSTTATVAAPTEPPASTPTEKPADTAVPPETKPSPPAGHALPAGALLLPRLQKNPMGDGAPSSSVESVRSVPDRASEPGASGIAPGRTEDGLLGTTAMIVLGFLALGLVVMREGRRLA